VISDLHAPYQHKDAIKFLAAIKEKYNPDRVINIGDEVDNHAMSFHPSDASLYSAGDELKAAREVIWQLEELFPKMDVMESNHGSLAYRKALVAGIPKEILRPYKEVLDVKHWNWHDKLTLTLPNKQPCKFIHTYGANYLLSSQKCGISLVQGHWHGRFGVQFWGTEERLNFAMSVGCLIDDKSMAYAYNKVTVERPILGSGMIVDSQPIPIPMVLNRKGKWIGRI